jgi:hypothetical protein
MSWLPDLMADITQAAQKHKKWSSIKAAQEVDLDLLSKLFNEQNGKKWPLCQWPVQAVPTSVFSNLPSK